MARLASSSVLLPLLLSALLIPAISAPAAAQATTAPDGRTVIPRDTANPERHRTLFTSRDAALAAAFVGLTVVMLPIDRHFAESLQDEDLQTNKAIDRAAKGVEWITTPGAFIIGGGLYAAGRATGNKNLTDLGWHGTEAVFLSSGVAGFLKGVFGRSRPNVTSDTNPRDFNLLKGFGRGPFGNDPGNGNKLSGSDYQSFPSGHTTTAFAAASAVTSEMRRMWPKSVWYVAPALYGGATLVGLGRMYHNRHWASDVVLGAAVGTFSGLKVVRYSHAHPDNKLDQLILGASVIPDGQGGGVLAFTLPIP